MMMGSSPTCIKCFFGIFKMSKNPTSNMSTEIEKRKRNDTYNICKAKNIKFAFNVLSNSQIYP